MKLFISTILLIIGVSVNAQPVPKKFQPLSIGGGPNYKATVKGAFRADSSTAILKVADTTSQYVGDNMRSEEGLLLKVGTKIYMRDTATKSWVLQSGSGGAGYDSTRYNFDSTRYINYIGGVAVDSVPIYLTYVKAGENITITYDHDTVVINSGGGGCIDSIKTSNDSLYLLVYNKCPVSHIDTFRIIGNSGTVTQVNAISLGTIGTDLSSTVANSTSMPTITLQVPSASSSNRGVLTNTDWILFNGKQSALSGAGYSKWSGSSVTYLTPMQVTADLDLFSSSLKGLVPLSGGGTTNYLRADGTWAPPSGGVPTAAANTAYGASYTSGTAAFLNLGAIARMSLFNPNYNFTDSGFLSMTTAINNIGIGRNVFKDITTGYENFAMGNSALSKTTTGVNNVAIGHRAMELSITGTSNVAIGALALSKATIANFETAIGTNALQADTSGTANVAVGMYSMYNNTNGASNTATGYQSLYNNKTGINNTAVGYNALYANVSGQSNTAVGLNALAASTTSGNTAIGYNAGVGVVGGYHNTIIGYNAAMTITTGIQNTIIGANISGLSSSLSNTVILTDGSGDIRIYSPSSKNLLIGTTTDVASSKLTIVSTTQGTIPFPVMTAAEKTAIGTPALGLHIYQSDGTEGVYVYKSSGWAFAY